MMERLSDRFMYYCGLLAMHGVSVDDLKHIQNLIDAESELEKYREIGTVEECREAMGMKFTQEVESLCPYTKEPCEIVLDEIDSGWK